MEWFGYFIRFHQFSACMYLESFVIIFSQLAGMGEEIKGGQYIVALCPEVKL